MVSSNDVQKLFLQAVISRRILSENLARIIWVKCIEAVKNVDQTVDISSRNTNEEWNVFLSQISKALDPLSLEFKHAMDEMKGMKYYGIANRKDDDVAQLATDYSPNEIAYFKAIIDQIMLAPNQSYSLSSLAALREASYLKGNMTKTQAENVLGSFVAKGWLLKSKKGRFSLSTRAILELQGYLKSYYADELLECTICMEILTKGVTCSKSNCHTYLHNHCYAVYSSRKPISCPSCREPWDHAVPIGEAAAKEGQDMRRRTKRQASGDNSNDEGSEAEMSNEEPKETQVQNKRGKGKGVGKETGKKRVSKGRKVVSESEETVDGDNDDNDIADAMDIDNLTVEDGRRRKR